MMPSTRGVRACEEGMTEGQNDSGREGQAKHGYCLLLLHGLRGGPLKRSLPLPQGHLGAQNKTRASSHEFRAKRVRMRASGLLTFAKGTSTLGTS